MLETLSMFIGLGEKSPQFPLISMVNIERVLACVSLQIKIGSLQPGPKDAHTEEFEVLARLQLFEFKYILLDLAVQNWMYCVKAAVIEIG